MAHQVPRKRRSDTSTNEPTYSEAIPELPDETLGFFTKRLQRTLQQRGHPVEEDEQAESPPLPRLFANFLNDELDLLQVSQRAADHLYRSQSGSPHEEECLFVTCEVSMMGKKGVAVMKLEREEGVQIETQDIDGKETLMVKVLDDLMLTDNTRLFKAGVFWLDRTTLYGSVSDTQQNTQTDIAQYFISGFLGCRFQKLPNVVTKDFFDAVPNFINSEVTDSEKKLNYYWALQTEVNSNKNNIDPVQFVADNFDLDHQDNVAAYLSDAGVPDAVFNKDTSKLSDRNNKSRLKTSNGLTIVGKPDEIHGRVTSEEYDGESAIIIRDTLVSI